MVPSKKKKKVKSALLEPKIAVDQAVMWHSQSVFSIRSFSMISSSVILPPFFFCLSAALEEASASGAGSGSITDLVYTCRNTPKKTFHKCCRG